MNQIECFKVQASVWCCRLRVGLLLGVCVVLGCNKSSQIASTPPESQKLVVYVAASTKGPMEALTLQFKSRTQTRVEITPGPSSGLAKQIIEGAPADLFLSADQASADILDKEKLVSERVNLLTNRLVIVVPASKQVTMTSVADLAKAEFGKIALAESKVPAGEYARQALSSASVLEVVQKKAVGGIDVKATLQLVAQGEVDAGIVYLTDSIGNSKISVALEIPAEMHQPISYPLVLVNKQPVAATARAFYEFLAGPDAAKVFRDAKFGVATR